MNDKTHIKKRRQFLIAGATALVAPKLAMAASNGYGIVGQQAPALKVEQWIDGQGKPSSFNLAAHKGKFVFMEFWQAWCPGCHSHGFPTLKKLTDEFKDSKYFVPVAIQTTFEGHSVNTANQMRIMQKRYELEIPMGHDAGKEGEHPYTMQTYRSGGTPWAVLISPEGDVLYNDFGINYEGAVKFLHEGIKKLS